MEQRLLDPLTAFETSLTNLVHSLTTTNTFAAAPRAARDLVAADDDLTEALTTLKKHQDNYQEILQLRTEKETLKNRLKNTIYECVRLKKDLRDINSRIVDESDTEDEKNSASQKPIDYETLIAFASRIGKHNADAAQEAEKESDRLHEETKKQREEERPLSQPPLNGTNGGDISTQSTTDRPVTSHSMHTEEAQARLKESRNIRLWERSQKTAPFPDAMILRFGVLGQLQVMKEDAGDNAVRAHLEQLVRESELKHSEDSVVTSRPAEPESEYQQPALASRSEDIKPAPQAQQAQQPPRARPTINLDLPDSDSDDSD